LIKNVFLAADQTDTGPASVLAKDGRIVRAAEIDDLTADEIIDGGGGTIFPGFIDIHIHGAVGVDVNEADAEGLIAIGEFLAKNGVTAWLPTFVPDSDENYRRRIDVIESVINTQHDRPMAQIVGVHYEGVYANEKMCGALRPEFFKTFTGGEVDRLPRLRAGAHMTTYAPEIEGGIELTRELVSEGWIASIGHTRAPIEVLDLAFAAGASHLTHFFNAMTGLHHRDVGVVGWAFSNDDVSIDIIADGRHVEPSVLKFACRSKTPANVTLISDSVAPTGLGNGEYKLWGETITVENSITRNERGSIAGSVITMADATRQMLKLDFSMADVAQMASHNPAKLLAQHNERGSIDVGKRADLVVLDADRCVSLVIIGGRVAYRV
ncbi:MAG: N-acetylglucosamine-6-phosphate deacetylase, partial [Acidobacteriota bacterium]